MTGDIREFLDAHRVGALATTAPDGTPRQSIVYYAREGDTLLVSTLTDRAKARDVRRTGWASLCVHGDEAPFPSAAFSGPAEILTEDIGGPTARVVQRVMGADEPPDPQTDDALASVGRVVLRITVERVTAVTHMPAAVE
jgi:PPOX class probable F420-dependent enzyme